MKITSIRVTHVNVPFDAPFWWSAGLYPGASKSIVEVETDEGIVGLGEAPWWHFGEAIEREIATALIGADPFDLADCEARCVPAYQITANTGENASMVAFGAVELALWDIKGKALDMPLYKLLGGAVRKEIPFTEYFSFRPEHESNGSVIPSSPMTPARTFVRAMATLMSSISISARSSALASVCPRGRTDAMYQLVEATMLTPVASLAAVRAPGIQPPTSMRLCPPHPGTTAAPGSQ